MDKVENGNIILHTNRTLEEVTGDQMGCHWRSSARYAKQR